MRIRSAVEEPAFELCTRLVWCSKHIEVCVTTSCDLAAGEAEKRTSAREPPVLKAALISLSESRTLRSLAEKAGLVSVEIPQQAGIDRARSRIADPRHARLGDPGEVVSPVHHADRSGIDQAKRNHRGQNGGDRTTMRAQRQELSQKMRDEVKAVLTADQVKQLGPDVPERRAGNGGV